MSVREPIKILSLDRSIRLLYLAIDQGAGKHQARVVATDPHKPEKLIRFFKVNDIIAGIHLSSSTDGGLSVLGSSVCFKASP